MDLRAKPWQLRNVIICKSQLTNDFRNNVMPITPSNKLSRILLHSPGLHTRSSLLLRRNTESNLHGGILLALDLVIFNNPEPRSLSQARKNTTVARTTVPAHTTEPTKLYGQAVFKEKASDFVDETAVEVPDPEAVAAGVARRVDRAISAVYVADRPVTFLQISSGAWLPATKLTAAHWKRMPSGAS